MKKEANIDEPFWKPRKIRLDELPPDYPSLLSIILAAISFLLTNKALCWFALLLQISCLTRIKLDCIDYKQIIVSYSFILSGMTINYLLGLW